MVHDQDARRSGGRHTEVGIQNSGSKIQGGFKGFHGAKRPFMQNDRIPGKPQEGGSHGGAGPSGVGNKRQRGK
eukprot:564354-Pelagomonas_calceolata.AAC.1